MSELKLTDEMVAKLKGVMPFSESAEHDFRLVIEGLPEEFYPTFTIRSLTVSEKERAKPLIVGTSGKKAEQYEKQLKNLVRKCLLGWDNVWDIGSRESIEYVEEEDGGCDRETFKVLTETMVSYIFRELLNISSLTTEAKLSLE